MNQPYREVRLRALALFLAFSAPAGSTLATAQPIGPAAIAQIESFIAEKRTRTATEPAVPLIDVSVSGIGPQDLGIGAIVVKSLNAGAAWTPLTSGSRGAILGNQWGNVGNVAYNDLDVGQSVRFGVRVVRVGSDSADLSDSRCNVRMVVYSRDGQASPF